MEATHRCRVRCPRCWTVSAAVIVLCSCFGPGTRRVAALSPEDQVFADFLIKDLAYYDTALRWFDSLEKQGRLDAKDQGDICWTRVDLLKAQDKKDESLKLAAECRRKFPNHPRSSLGNLDTIKAAMPKVIKLFGDAVREPDQAKAAAQRSQATKMFEDEVSKPLDALIADLQKKLDDARKAARSSGADAKGKKAGPRRDEPPEVTNLLRSLEYAELTRVQFYLTYSRQLAEDSPERKTLLEKGAKLAEAFVNDRFDFPVMYYNAQLHRGLYAFELGRFADAEEHMSPLYDIVPPVQRPFKKDVIDEFKLLRLQAILFGARARNTARSCPKAVQLIHQYYLAPRMDEFDLTKAEDDPVLLTIAVLVRLEYGIALAGSGQAQKGLEEIEKMINKPGLSAELLTDARKALGRIAVMGGVQLRARDYYQAAIGLKSDLRWDEAIDTFQEALSKLSSRNMKETNEVAPLCLNQIGEINHRLKNYVEAAVAYQEVCRNFPGAPPEFLATVARNFLSSVDKAAKAIPNGTSHSGLLELKDEAAKEAEKYSAGFATLELLMSEAKPLEKDGKYKEAHQKYLQVPREQKGVKVPFYWRAQANAWTCIYREWELADEEGRKKLEDDLVKAIAELDKIVPSAIKEGDKTGAAVAALTLGQAHYYRSDYQKAADTLKLFTTDLAGEDAYRCFGLGTLVLAESKMGTVDDAEKHFKENLYSQKECKANAIIAVAASGLADGFEAAGSLKKAALYALVFAKHASSKAEMEKPEALAQLIRRLIDGERVKDAQPYLEKLKGLKATDACQERQIAALDARIYQATKEWNKVIAKLEKYREDFKPHVEDKCYEDAYVLRDLAVAYLSREPRAPLKDLKESDQWYNTACGLMQRRAQRDKSLEKTFWQWALELMKVKMRLGEAGEVNAYLNITNFVASQESQEGDWGGTKDQLLELSNQAAERYAKAKK